MCGPVNETVCVVCGGGRWRLPTGGPAAHFSRGGELSSFLPPNDNALDPRPSSFPSLLTPLTTLSEPLSLSYSSPTW